MGVPSKLKFTPKHEVLSFPPTHALCKPILREALTSKCIPNSAQSTQSTCVAPSLPKARFSAFLSVKLPTLDSRLKFILFLVCLLHDTNKSPRPG